MEFEFKKYEWEEKLSDDKLIGVAEQFFERGKYAFKVVCPYCGEVSLKDKNYYENYKHYCDKCKNEFYFSVMSPDYTNYKLRDKSDYYASLARVDKKEVFFVKTTKDIVSNGNIFKISEDPKENLDNMKDMFHVQCTTNSEGWGYSLGKGFFSFKKNMYNNTIRRSFFYDIPPALARKEHFKNISADYGYSSDLSDFKAAIKKKYSVEFTDWQKTLMALNEKEKEVATIKSESVKKEKKTKRQLLEESATAFISSLKDDTSYIKDIVNEKLKEDMIPIILIESVTSEFIKYYYYDDSTEKTVFVSEPFDTFSMNWEKHFHRGFDIRAFSYASKQSFCTNDTVLDLCQISCCDDNQEADKSYIRQTAVCNIITSEASEDWVVLKCYGENYSYYFNNTENKVVRKLIDAKSYILIDKNENTYYYTKEAGLNTLLKNDFKEYWNGSNPLWVLSNSSYRKDYTYDNKDDIYDTIKNSFLKNSGLIESWEQLYPVGNVRFLFLKKKYSIVELAVKIKMFQVVKDIDSYFFENLDRYSCIGICDLNAPNIRDCFKISKWTFKVAREENLGIYGINKLEVLHSLDPNITYQDYKKVCGLRDVDRVVALVRDYDLTVAKILDYFEKAYAHQCINERDTLYIWSDYLDMARKMHYDFSDKNILFPTSLKKEHDIAVFNFNLIKEKLSQENFLKTVDSYRELEYKTANYSVIFPESPNDVIREGKEQKHCVATYVEKVANNKCCICFIRENSNINQAFYTIELSPYREIVQVKGFCNKAPTKDVIEFVKKWAAAKKLAYDPTRY